MRVRAAVVAVLAIVALVGPAGTDAAAETSDHVAVQQAMDDLVAAGATGVQLRMRDETGTWTASAGVAERGRPEGVPVDGRFRIGSITKTFVATVLLQMVGEGRLGLDDPVARHLPRLTLDERITVRMILGHTSGLFDYTGRDTIDGTLQSPLSEDTAAVYRPEDLVRWAVSMPLRFEPGTEWRYSNTNYLMAGLLIEELTGLPYAAQVYLRIIVPLGLWGTEIPSPSAAIRGPHAHGYWPVGPDGAALDVTGWNPSWAGAAGEMISTTADLDTFLAALAEGRLLAPHLMAEMQAFRPAPDETLGYGLGLSELKNRSGCHGIGHNGAIPGYYSWALSTPDGRRRVVMSVTDGAGNLGDEEYQTARIRPVILAFCGS
ncbi:serine hydrolase domain-containing protein [Nocardia sp. NPDC050710]|uniref:serine hydrolase domain-containing protein n=1 Tax=Nocardia sp. NPDC050710 TaxID=3157220 RepID=UPI0033EAF2AD